MSDTSVAWFASRTEGAPARLVAASAGWLHGSAGATVGDRLTDAGHRALGAAIAVAGGVAVGWGWNHALSGTATALLVPGSIAGAATLAWFCIPLVRGICPQRPALAMGAAAFLVFGVLPAAVSLPAWKHVKSGRSRHANGPHSRTPAASAASCTMLMTRS